MDKRWELKPGTKKLIEVKYILDEQKRRDEDKKYYCCACKNEIPVTPGYTFDHHGWMEPVVECGAVLIRQMEYQGWADILYICQKCRKESEYNEHLAIEKKYHIPRP